MKKNTRWGGIVAGIIGGILLACQLVGAATIFANPSHLPLVDAATLVQDLLWSAVSIFLLFVFIRSRQKGDVEPSDVKLEPNSSEDRAVLEKRRNWIFGFVLSFLFISSSDVWILNNYVAGFTLVNIEIIFDLILNLFFLYAIIKFFRNDSRIYTPFFYAVIAYSVVEAVLDAVRGRWTSIVMGLLTLAYFVYALKAPQTRKNYRLAHFIGLPVLLICVFVLNTFDGAPLIKIQNDIAKLGGQYDTLTRNISSDYIVFRQKTNPSADDIQNIINEVAQRDQISSKMSSNSQKIREYYATQLPNITQAKALDYVQKFENLLAVNKQQSGTIHDLMEYSLGIDFAHMTREQQSKIASFEQKVSDQENQITTAQVELNTP